MKNPRRIPGRDRSAIQALKTCALALCTLAVAAGAFAQTVVVTPPALPEPRFGSAPTQPAPGTVHTNLLDIEAGAPAGTTLPPRLPFQWGELSLHPHLSYSLTYATGVRSQTNNSSIEKTTVQQLAPGLRFDLGSHWRLDYTANATFYDNTNFHDVVDHSIVLEGNATKNDWSFMFSQNIALTSDPRVETGTQTDQQNYITTLGAVRQLNSDTALELGLAQNFRITPDFQSSRSWSTMDWLSRQWTERIALSVGAGFGYEDLDAPSPDMTYEQFQGRITLQVTDKVRFSLNSGIEIRQFFASGTNSARQSLVSPVFGAALDWHPFDYTTVSLSASRTVSGSYFQNQLSVNTGFTAGISQRLMEHLFIGMSGGFANTAYESTSTTDTAREDNYDFWSINLTTTFLKRGSASLFYSTSHNSSDADGLSFHSNQVGFSLAYRY